jgi:hypothetical protein
MAGSLEFSAILAMTPTENAMIGQHPSDRRVSDEACGTDSSPAKSGGSARPSCKRCVVVSRYFFAKRCVVGSHLANTLADAARVREHDLLRTLEQSSAWLEGRVVLEDPSPTEHVARAEQLRRLAEGLLQLSEDERTAVEMRYLQDPPCPLPDIARALGRPTAKAVAGLLARGLEKLRGLLREDL